MKKFRGFIEDRGGAAALEFALIGLPFIILLLGLMEFGRGLYIRAALDAAADRAQRLILINPTASSEMIESEIRGAFILGQPDRLEVPVPTKESGALSGTVYTVVRLRYTMGLILPAPIGGDISISATRRVAMVP